jgi:hypothetical protein
MQKIDERSCYHASYHAPIRFRLDILFAGVGKRVIFFA